jgi:hypothetical protein
MHQLERNFYLTGTIMHQQREDITQARIQKSGRACAHACNRTCTLRGPRPEEASDHRIQHAERLTELEIDESQRYPSLAANER